jgi:hypothetical protein
VDLHHLASEFLEATPIACYPLLGLFVRERQLISYLLIW